MLTTEGKERSFGSNVTLAVALSCVAGMVNAAGFFAVGTYTSHVTGNVSHAGDELAKGNKAGAIAAFALVAFFIAGAITASALVQGAQRRLKARYAATLMLEAGVLFSFTLVSAWVKAPSSEVALALTGILCFAMGMQNALVTRISGAVIRTTHITGIATDLGIELVALVFWFREKSEGKRFWSRLSLLLELPRNPEMKKFWLHAIIFASFIGGAIAGPMLYLRHQQLAMLLPAGIIVALVGFDLVVNLVQRTREAGAAQVGLEAASAQGGGSLGEAVSPGAIDPTNRAPLADQPVAIAEAAASPAAAAEVELPLKGSS